MKSTRNSLPSCCACCFACSNGVSEKISARDQAGAMVQSATKLASAIRFQIIDLIESLKFLKHRLYPPLLFLLLFRLAIIGDFPKFSALVVALAYTDGGLGHLRFEETLDCWHVGCWTRA